MSQQDLIKRANATSLASKKLAETINWSAYIVEEKLSSSKIARKIGKGEKWVRDYVPAELKQQLTNNGLMNRKNISKRSKPRSTWNA